MRILAAAIASSVSALCLTIAVAPPAAAGGNDTTVGGCGFDAQPTPPNYFTYTGVLRDSSVTRDGNGLPIGATVTCKIEVNGVDAPGASADFLGYGAQAGAATLSFTATDTDVIVLCQRTVYADGADSGWDCPDSTGGPFPPDWVIDALNTVFGVVDGIEVWDVDPRSCPVLAAHPGSYGPLTVNPDGDVYTPDPLGLGLNPVYDCPPYGNF